MAMDMYPPEKDLKYYLPNLGMFLFYQVLMNTYWLFCSCCTRCVLTVSTSLELVP